MKRKRRDPLPRLVSPQTVMKIGASYAVVIPPKWFKAHKVNPRKLKFLYVGGNTDLTLFNPKDAAMFERFVDVRTSRARKLLKRRRRR